MRQHRMWAAALLGAAALLLTPAVSSAQVSMGIGRFGVGVGTPYYGYGYYPGYYNSGYYPTRWGYSPAWYGNYYSPGYALSTGNGSYPSYAYSSDYYSTPAMPYSYSSPADSSSYYNYGSLSRDEANTARLNVRLPDPDAQVWVENSPTQQRGTQREYVSPPLNPNKSYTYEVRARWMENGKEVQRTKSVPIRANGSATVDFTASGNNSRVDDIDKDGDRRGRDADRDRPGADKLRPGDTPPPTDVKRPSDRGNPDRP